MKRYLKLRYRQQGMTLIEIMISLLIGAFLLGGVLSIFVNSKRSYELQDALNRIQENGRFAIEFLRNDLRMAGFWECRPAIDIGMGTAIQINGINGAIVGTNDIATGTNLLGTDTIAAGWRNGSWDGPWNGMPLACTSTINNPTIVRYEIRAMPGGYNSLFRQLNPPGDNSNFQELIEGVEDMQILYGVDPNASIAPPYIAPDTPSYYVPADLVPNTVPNMFQVISIRITLVVASIAPVGSSQNSPDQKIRRTFTTTIKLRNN